MMIFAIDPGPDKSAGILWGGREQIILDHWLLTTNEMILKLQEWHPNLLAVEMIASYGMPVGREIFETCVNIGRFLQTSTAPSCLIYRKEIKMHFCHSMRAKDANIRRAIIDRLGAPGTKRIPGKTFGISGDEWAALAVALYCDDHYLQIGKGNDL